MSAAVLDGDVKESLDTRSAEPGDHDKFSHYVRKEDILESQVNGKPAIALCGKVWNPTSDPNKYSVCPECQDIYDNVVGTGRGAKE